MLFWTGTLAAMVAAASAASLAGAIVVESERMRFEWGPVVRDLVAVAGDCVRFSSTLDALGAERTAATRTRADALELGLVDGGMARVTSRRGSIELAVRVSHREARGNCFIPFHFREAAANLLTIDALDPMGKIPEFKFCAVRIEPAGGDGNGAAGGNPAAAGIGTAAGAGDRADRATSV
jgi:formylmethanofuran dehydrogenase subunit D